MPRFRIRTMLQAAAGSVNSQPIFSSPLHLALRSQAAVFIQPKISSPRLRFLWLTA